MNRLSQIATIGALLLGGSAFLFAHHSFASEFDANKPISVKGIVKSVEWGEPHVNFVVTDNRGSTPQDWKFEGASASTLDRNGWNATNRLKSGDTVTVQGFRAIDGSMMASARSIEIADGRVLSISDSQEDGGPAPQLTSEGSPVQLPRMGSRVPFLIVAAFAIVFLAWAMSRRRHSA